MSADDVAGAEPENAWAGQGAVLLDIGGDVGALVVAMPESAVGLEVEIRPLDGRSSHEHGHEHEHRHEHEHGHGHSGSSGHSRHHDAHDSPHHLAHVAVVARPVAGGRQPSLVFGELEQGRYQLFEKGRPDAVAMTVEVTGGAVTSAAWPARLARPGCRPRWAPGNGTA